LANVRTVVAPQAADFANVGVGQDHGSIQSFSERHNITNTVAGAAQNTVVIPSHLIPPDITV
jgi:hypothetical protein